MDIVIAYAGEHFGEFTLNGMDRTDDETIALEVQVDRGPFLDACIT